MAIPKSIDARNKIRLARLCPSGRGRALQFLSECATAGLDVVVLEVERDDAKQLEHFKKGRRAGVDGKWHVVGKVVTKARTAAETPHGRRGPDYDKGACAFDFAKCTGEKTADWSDPDFFRRCGEIGERIGLAWGGRFGESLPGKGDGWDGGHLEVPGWKERPLLPKDSA